MQDYKILVINPGSTSTKISLFHNETRLFTTNVFHDAPVLLQYPTVNEQLPYRKKVILEFLEQNGVDIKEINVFVARGGSSYPLEGGVYVIDDKLVEDTRLAKRGIEHPSNLGVQLASEFCKEYGGQMFTSDPPVVDELCDLARMTGIDGVYRKATHHVLNLKETARVHAAKLGKKYEDCNFIVCHIDGGISVSAHEHGRIMDGNDIAGGDGPYTPTRIGSVSVADLIEYCRGKDLDEVKKLCTRTGGFVSYFGTSNSDTVHKMMEDGDKRAWRVWNGMIFQIIKYIGAMSTVLGGKVDGILLGGGLLRFDDLVQQITDKCGWIAPVTSYPGEFEQEALAYGALRVLRGEEQAKHYTGVPVWDGFHD